MLGPRMLNAVSLLPVVLASSAYNTRAIDTSWYSPARTALNNLTSVLDSHGVYGFIFNSSSTPNHNYGTYNWCNMPHVRPAEYVVPDKSYELQYVELVCQEACEPIYKNMFREILRPPLEYHAHVLRFKDTTSEHHMPPTLFQLNHTSGIATMPNCSYMVSLFKGIKRPPYFGKGTLRQPTRLYHLAGLEAATSHRLRQAAWPTRGSMVLIFTLCIMISWAFFRPKLPTMHLLCDIVSRIT